MSQDPIAPPPPPTPPAAPPPPPPPDGGGAEGPRLPWEERDRLGFVDALIDTVKLLVTAPAEAFSRLRADGDLIWPLVFGLILSWIGQFFYQIWNLLFGAVMQSMLGGFGDFEELAFVGGTNVAAMILSLVIFPVLYLIGIFIGAGIYHLCLMLVGATGESPLGFEGTLKVAAYSSVADLANVVPIFGMLIALVIKLILTVVGFIHVHKTTTGKAVAAVLIPIALCCVCLIIFGASIAAMIGLAGN